MADFFIGHGFVHACIRYFKKNTVAYQNNAFLYISLNIAPKKYRSYTLEIVFAPKKYRSL